MDTCSSGLPLTEFILAKRGVTPFDCKEGGRREILSSIQTNKITHVLVGHKHLSPAHTCVRTQTYRDVNVYRDFVLPTTKFGDAARVPLADMWKVLINGASKANNSNSVLFLCISQMLLFFWVDIKDCSLFCHLKGNDKIKKKDE